MIVLISYRNLVWPRIFDTLLSLIDANQHRLRPPELPRLSPEALAGVEKRLGVIGQDVHGDLRDWIGEWSSEIAQNPLEDIQGNVKETTQGSIQTQSQSFRLSENKGGYAAEAGASTGRNPEGKIGEGDFVESPGVYGPYFSLYHYICPSLSDPMISALNLQKLPASVLFGGGMLVDCFEGGSEARAADQLETLSSLIGIQHGNQTLRTRILELQREVGKASEVLDFGAMRRLAAEVAPLVPDDPALRRLTRLLHLEFTRGRSQAKFGRSSGELPDFGDPDALPGHLTASQTCRHILKALEAAPVEHSHLLEQKFLSAAEKVADPREKAQLIGEFSRLVN